MGDPQQDAVDEAYRRLRARDACAAIETVLSRSVGLEAVRQLGELAKRLYWKDKDLPAYLHIAQAAAAIGIAEAHRIGAGDPEAAREALLSVRVQCYNIGSFTWPGWLEPGISIGPGELAAGRDAAAANLRMAEELDCGEIAVSRAHWLVGAHQLAAEDFEGAAASFDRAAEFARGAGSSSEELLGRGYRCLAQIRLGSTDAALELQAVLAELAKAPEGDCFADQLVTARQWLGAG